MDPDTATLQDTPATATLQDTPVTATPQDTADAVCANLEYLPKSKNDNEEESQTAVSKKKDPIQKTNPEKHATEKETGDKNQPEGN